MKRFFLLMLGFVSVFATEIAFTKEAVFTILTFNDVYEIVPDQKGRGGFAEMMTLLEEERGRSAHCITTVNGDFLSPCILSIFDKGAHRVDLFNKMKIDVVSLGNHEFDFGPDEVLKRIKESEFPWLAANAIGLDGHPFTGDQQKIIVDVEGIKVGIFGLVTVETPELSSTEKKVCFAPLVYTARQIIQDLKEEGVEVFIALTHLLFEEDKMLAEEVPDIHLILGGHDHEVFTYYDNTNALVHKSGQNAYYLTRVDLFLDKDEKTGRVSVLPSWNVILNKGRARDPEVAAKVDALQNTLEKITAGPIGVMKMSCDSMSGNMRSKESLLGNLFADALRVSCEADLAFITGGIIRGNRFYEPGYQITLKDLLTELPFGNLNVMVETSGAAILAALENGVSQVEGKAGRFPQVSGLSFMYDINQPPGKRIHDVYVQGLPLDPERIYRMATVDYMLNGGDGYSMFKEGKVLLSPLKQISLISSIASYLKLMPSIESFYEGRIQVKPFAKGLDDVSFNN